MTWNDFPGPSRHQAELDASHQGQPSLEEQDRTHGAPMPAEDRGSSDAYGNC